MFSELALEVLGRLLLAASLVVSRPGKDGALANAVQCVKANGSVPDAALDKTRHMSDSLKLQVLACTHSSDAKQGRIAGFPSSPIMFFF